MNDKGTHAVEVLKKLEITKPAPAEISVATASMYDRVLEVALTKDTPLDQLEKFLQLKREDEANEARKAYFKDLALFHQEKIELKKDKFNRQYESWYTSLGQMLETVSPFLAKHGFSTKFIPIQPDKKIGVECVLQHRFGHTDSVSMFGPPDSSGKKNPLQEIRSTLTYLRSATFESITGLAGTDASADDDGNSGTSIKTITDTQLKELKAMYKELNPSAKQKEKLMEIAEAETLGTIRAENFAKVRQAISAAIDAKPVDREPGEEG